MLGILTPRDLRDVVAYLSSLKPSKAKAGKKDEHWLSRSVLECAGPPALSNAPRSTQSSRGLELSKALRASSTIRLMCGFLMI